MDPDQMLEHLDPDQRVAATTWGRPVAVIAGAGTGKTRTITHRLAYAARTGRIDPGATLALTFTTTAAAEVRDRLAAMGVGGVQSRTFHSACLRQARHFWPEIYNADLPRVADSRDDLIAQACHRLGLPATDGVVREIDAEIAWAKQTNVLPEYYTDLAAAAGRRLAHLTTDDAADAIVAYEQAKQAACVIDLDDLLLCTVALLGTEAARQVRARYRHFVFDEFQDISPVQSRLVELWVGGRDDVAVVGDPAQTIHSFAGSTARYLQSFGADHAGAAELELRFNYRSTPQILAAARRVGGQGGTLTAVRPAGAPLELAPAPTSLDEATATAAWLKARHADGVAWGDMGVLFRTRAAAEGIRQILADEGVPFAYAQGQSSAADRVWLGTMHAAKGREWEAVAVGGLSDSAVPHPLAGTTEQLAEERRLLYVAMTRARSFLRLSWPVTEQRRPVGASRFLAGLAGSDPA